MNNEWDHINTALKSSDKNEGEPVFPWHELEGKVKHANFFRFSPTTFNIYYLSIVIIFAFWAGLSTYQMVNLNHQLNSINLSIANRDSINNSNKNFKKIITEKENDSGDINDKMDQGQKDALAYNMKKSSFFENLMSSNLRISDIEVVAPLPGQKFRSKEAIIFKFEGDLSMPLDVIIYNNSEVKILEKSDILTNSYSPNIKLTSGLYYWKLIRNDDLIFVGKFYIK